MKHTFILLISALLFCCPVDAQERVIDSTDRSPISAAFIFDAIAILVTLLLLLLSLQPTLMEPFHRLIE